MQLQDRFFTSPFQRKIIFASISLFLLLILAYGNSFEASWHFDDYPNIVANANLHITDLSPQSLKQGLYGKNGSTIFRPIAMLSFALNYYFDEYNVWGYHFVNFSIHYLNALGLFLFIYFTLTLPNQKKIYGEIAYPVALIATIFWATNPVQVSAVTYIVQRMTCLAGLGYIYSMLFYLFARSSGTHKKYLYYGLSALMALLAFASKENSFMLPISIVLFDLFLITGINKKRTIRIYILFGLAILAVLVASSIFTNISATFNGYGGRPFSLSERLLTEPRIIIFYLSLLFYPTADRLTFLHDIELSTSLFTPISTFLSLTLITVIIFFTLISTKKRPFVTYCVIFFFINHIIEGTFIPLELIYEHRNYLPSMLIFVPLAILCVETINYFSYNHTLQSCFALGLVIVLGSQSNTTSMRNAIYKSEISLWQDCVDKTPELQRALINLGAAYSQVGQNAKAIKYLKKAQVASHITNKLPTKLHQLINTNIGAIYYDMGEFDEARKYSVIDIKNQNSPAKNMALNSLILLGEDKLPESENFISRALTLAPSDPSIAIIYSKILFKKGLIKEAVKAARYALKLDKTRDQALLIIGLSLRTEGKYKRAIRYFKNFLGRRPFNINGHLALVEVCQVSGSNLLRDKYVAEIVGLSTPELLKKSLNLFYAHFESEDYSPRENIHLAFSKVLREYSQNLKEKAMAFDHGNSGN